MVELVPRQQNLIGRGFNARTDDGLFFFFLLLFLLLSFLTLLRNKSILSMGGAVAEWSKVLLVRENKRK